MIIDKVSNVVCSDIHEAISYWFTIGVLCTRGIARSRNRLIQGYSGPSTVAKQ